MWPQSMVLLPLAVAADATAISIPGYLADMNVPHARVPPVLLLSPLFLVLLGSILLGCTSSSKQLMANTASRQVRALGRGPLPGCSTDE